MKNLSLENIWTSNEILTIIRQLGTTSSNPTAVHLNWGIQFVCARLLHTEYQNQLVPQEETLLSATHIPVSHGIGQPMMLMTPCINIRYHPLLGNIEARFSYALRVELNLW